MKSVFSLLLSAAYVVAHGSLGQVTIDGTTYMGNAPGQSPANPSIIRQISTIDPVKGANNSYLNCGQAAQPGSQVGNANPGSIISFLWVDQGGQVSFPLHIPSYSIFFYLRNVLTLFPSGLTSLVR